MQCLHTPHLLADDVLVILPLHQVMWVASQHIQLVLGHNTNYDAPGKDSQKVTHPTKFLAQAHFT